MDKIFKPWTTLSPAPPKFQSCFLLPRVETGGQNKSNPTAWHVTHTLFNFDIWGRGCRPILSSRVWIICPSTVWRIIIVIPIRNTVSSSFAILKCFFNVKALLDISGEANQRLLPIGRQWSTMRPVKCWTFEGPWTAFLSWWSCDLLLLLRHCFLTKASRKSKRQLSRLTKFNDHDEGKWEGRRTTYAFIEHIDQHIHQETSKKRYHVQYQLIST